MNNNLFRIHLLISVLLLAAPTMLADAAKILIVYFAVSRSFYRFYIMWIYLDWYCETKRFEFSGWNWNPSIWWQDVTSPWHTVVLNILKTDWDVYVWGCKMKREERKKKEREKEMLANSGGIRLRGEVKWSEVREKKCMNTGNERV